MLLIHWTLQEPPVAGLCFPSMRFPLLAAAIAWALLVSCRKESSETLEDTHPFPACSDSMGLGNPGDCPPVGSPPSATPSESGLAPDARSWGFARTGDSLVARNSQGDIVGLAGDEDSKDDPEEGCESNSSASPRSLVGGIASWFVSAGGYCPGTAHPWAISSFHTLDLRTGQPASLRDIFSDAQLVKAFRSEGVVRKLLESPLDSLNQIEELYDTNCVMGFSSAMWTTFAFHHVKGDSVAVRVGLSHGCEAARGSFTQLGIMLPIPEAWKEALHKADNEGLLMRQLEKRDRETP